MKPNIIKANNSSWIHDHKRVFMLVYSEGICTVGHTKMKELKAKLRKYKIRHRIVEQEYPNEGHSPQMFWDIYVEVPYCRLPERFPEHLTTSVCPPNHCPTNCCLKGIAALHHGKDGKGRDLPDHIREINHIIFPTQQLESPPTNNNYRYIFSPPINLHSMEESPIDESSIQTIEIDISNMVPSRINGLYVPTEVRQQAFEQMRRMLNDNNIRELRHGEFNRERIEGVLRRTADVQTTQLLFQRLGNERYGIPPTDYARRIREHLSGLGVNDPPEHPNSRCIQISTPSRLNGIAHSASSIGITHQELSDSMRALGRASNSLYGSVGRTFRIEGDIPVVERLPEHGHDTEMVWIDNNRNAGYLYMSVVNDNSRTYIWDLVTQEVLQRLRPERHVQLFTGICGFEPTDINSSRDAGSSDIRMTFSDDNHTVEIIVCPDGLISLCDRSHSIPAGYRHPRRHSTSDDDRESEAGLDALFS